MAENKKSYSLMRGSFFIDSIRSTGYKNTGYALGELIDNSIQANATAIHIVVESSREMVNSRMREKINRISVIDNGDGMNRELLRSALMFGEGINREGRTNRLGKYGVGLPQASLSQAQVINVWSWTKQSNDVYATGFDIRDEDWRMKGAEIPLPEKSEIPAEWKKYVDKESKSGTIVSWSTLDRVTWRNSKALFDNVEQLIGRMYRYWINDGTISIYYDVLDNDTKKESSQKLFRAVDPLYLMENTNVKDMNPPVNPMFDGNDPIILDIQWKDGKYPVTIKSSIAKEEVRKKVNKVDMAGNEPYGKDALRNIGVSIVRERRELELVSDWNPSITNKKDSRNRWWGIEIDFPSELDDLFGVTNDKQHANRLVSLANKTYKDFAITDENGKEETNDEVSERLELDDPATSRILQIVNKVNNLAKNLLSQVPSEESNVSSSGKKDNKIVERKATENTKKMKDKGEIGSSDKDEAELSNEEKKSLLVEALKNDAVSEEEIEEIVSGYVDSHNKYHFAKVYRKNEESFFIPVFNAGAIVIELNTAHPMYKRLFEIFDFMDENRRKPEDKNIDQTTYALLSDVYEGMKLMLAAWARLEDEAIERNKQGPTNNRRKWGTMMKRIDGDDIDDDDFDE